MVHGNGIDDQVVVINEERGRFGIPDYDYSCLKHPKEVKSL
jgi:hypothetical protein